MEEKDVKKTSKRKRTKSKKEQDTPSVRRKPNKRRLIFKNKIGLKTNETVEKNEVIVDDSNNSFVNRDQIITLILSAIIIVILIVCIILARQENEAKKIASSYMSQKSYTNIISTMSELSDIIEKSSDGSDIFIMIGYYGDTDAYELEEGVYEQVSKYNLELYYFDATDYLEDEQAKSRLASILLVDDIEIPAILYYKNGYLRSQVERDDTLQIQHGDFQKLLDIYQLTD